MNSFSPPQLTEADVNPDPVKQFTNWYDEAVSVQIPEPSAMVLATATPEGRPSARVVLLRGFDHNGFRFFTNYRSRKAKELEANPNAALLFFWESLDRQIRIEGRIEKTSPEVSDDYFRSRPRESRLSAWASEQSETILNRKVLEERMQEFEQRFPMDEVPRPPHWGGYILIPRTFEFWQGGLHRLHDRIQYIYQGDAIWLIRRLAP